MMTAKELVLQATAELFDKRDASAVDRYWADSYIEHSTQGGPAREALRAIVVGLPDGSAHEKIRVLSEGDLVVAHGLYHGLGPHPIVGCDVWRVADGKIVEHWDAHQPAADRNSSGHSMLDGPSEVREPGKTAASRKLVGDFVELIMMGGDRSQLPRFFDGDSFIQHNPLIADGVSGLGGAIQSGVWGAVVERCHRIIADGEFVFTQGEGTLGGVPTAFYDIFRVENGKLAEHWDVVFAKPARLPHDNGLF
jgi:predicted SnoaL-like aldol condensation-catalyzing enzyme